MKYDKISLNIPEIILIINGYIQNDKQKIEYGVVNKLSTISPMTKINRSKY